MRHASVIFALLAAILFGGSIPLAKFFVGNLNFFMLAGLLYFGSGLGLFYFGLLVTRHGNHQVFSIVSGAGYSGLYSSVESSAP